MKSVNSGEFFRRLLLLTIVILPVVGLAYAFVELWMDWVRPVDLALFLGFYAVTTLGVAMGFHRMLTHKAFDAPAPVRFILLALGSLTLEGSCVAWAATHTKHHAKSDKEGDPHSPLEGFWHAHVGWLFKHGLKVEPIYYRGFEGDRVAHLVDRLFPLWIVLSFGLPFAIGFAAGGLVGGFSGLVWGGLVRVFFNQHVTWSVNSVCHTFGRTQFVTTDRSKNEWLVGLLAFGEGWHNNHHAFPRAAIHGMRWYQFDLSGYLIRFLAWCHLVRNVWIVKKGHLLRKFARSSSGQPQPAPVEA